MQLLFGKRQAPLTVILPLGPSAENLPEIRLKVHKELAYKAETDSLGRGEEATALQG